MTKLIVQHARRGWLWLLLLLTAAPLAAQVTTQDAPPHHARINAIVPAAADPASGGLPLTIYLLSPTRAAGRCRVRHWSRMARWCW